MSKVALSEFKRHISNAKILDGEVRLVGNGSVEKVNFGGAWRSVISSSARMKMVNAGEENSKVRQAFYDALKDECRDKLIDVEVKKCIKQLLLDANREKPLSRRTIGQVFSILERDKSNASLIGVDLTKEQYCNMIDRGVAIAILKNPRYRSELSKLGRESKADFVRYARTNFNLNNFAMGMRQIFSGSLDDETVADSLLTNLFNTGTIVPCVSSLKKKADDSFRINNEKSQDTIEGLHHYLLANSELRLGGIIDLTKCKLYNQADTKEQAVKDLVANLFANSDTRQMEISGRKDGERIVKAFTSNWNLFMHLLNNKEEKDETTKLLYKLIGTFSETLQKKIKQFLTMRDLFKGPITPNDVIRYCDVFAAKAKCLKIEEEIDEIARMKLEEMGRSIADGIRFPKGEFKSRPLTIHELKRTDLQNLPSAIMEKAGDEVRFAEIVIKNYFQKIDILDCRLIMANAIRDISAPIDKGNGIEFRGVLTGVGPCLAKILQGFETGRIENEELRKAFDCLKTAMPPIRKEIVQAEILKLIKSNPEIAKIDIVESLGCASVGQAFKVKIYYVSGRNNPVDAVIKLIRPDAKLRLERESRVIEDAAQEIPGFWNTYKLQLKTFEKELDLTREGANIKDGAKIYNKNLRKALDENGNKVREFDGEFTSRMGTVVGGCEDWRTGKHEIVRYQSVSLVPGIKPTTSCLVMSYNGPETISGLMRRGSQIVEALRCKDEAERLTLLKALNIKTRKDAAQELLKITKRLKATNLALRQLSRDFFNEALFGDGFYHGDLHAGNMLADEAGNVTLIDYGNAAKISSKGLFKLLLSAMTCKDRCFPRAPKFVLEIYGKMVSDVATREFLANEEKRRVLELKLYLIFNKDRGAREKDAISKIFAFIALLKSEGLPIPNGIFNFLQSLGRLTQTVCAVRQSINTFSRRLWREADNDLSFSLEDLETQPIHHEDEALRDDWDIISDVTDVFDAHAYSFMATVTRNAPKGFTRWALERDTDAVREEALAYHSIAARAIEKGYVQMDRLFANFRGWCAENGKDFSHKNFKDYESCHPELLRK